ncbi:threonine--tRNA ligase [Streptomyces sp. NPDC059349]|uniref:threonine--tRNA ligase n=1 Tax=Streptomyces sp. NPDC059349 TaxID=3346808 RepID=UPI0036C5936A
MSNPTDRPRSNVVARRVNGKLQDLSDPIRSGAEVEEVTLTEPDGLDILRHTLAAQVLGRAVKSLYPDSKLAIGPTITDGFYYDIQTDVPISSEDLPKIEEKMREIIAENRAVKKAWVERSSAISLFEKRSENFKVEILEADDAESFSIYEQVGSDFVDLCRGPHLESLGLIDPAAFALVSVSGAYWRGDSQNAMLTRIYGTAWSTRKELRIHLDRLEEAKRRDHRLLAAKMGLFHLGPESPGQVFWHPAGWTLFQELTGFIREKLRANDYQEVNTPRMVSQQLYERSGHWSKFGTENMFTSEAYGESFALKPMNCPSHILLYQHDQRSYRDLPVRLAEFGNCYRRELSGALHGLMRVTSMTQDDAHVFCTLDQVQEEIVVLNAMIEEIYRTLGFENYYVRFSDRPARRIGDDETWDRAEGALLAACEAAGVKTVPNPGEGAFYGPKLEYVLTDSLGRDWQCGTIQLDFNLPERLGATYVAPSGARERPVMIHRAIIGTVERFLGIFLEQHAKWLPLWIAPTQIAFSPISEGQAEHAKALAETFRADGLRAEWDRNHDDRISQRIRDHSQSRVPLIAVIGDQEVSDGTVSLRMLGNKRSVSLPVDELRGRLSREVRTRSLNPSGILEA